MKIKSGYMLREIAGGYFAVPMGDGNNRMITLNESGKDMWRALEKGADAEELLAVMAELYDADRETLKRDIEKFIKELCDAQLLED